MTAEKSNHEQTDEGGGGNQSPKTQAMYARIIETIFFDHYRKGLREFEFDREEIEATANELYRKKEIALKKPKNLGDVIYSFRHRRPLPPAVLATQSEDRSWIILGAGDAKYRFRLNKLAHIKPRRGLTVTKIPDATPEIILEHALNDEQALLAKMRYNRMIDIFLGLTAYSLQNHLRTKIPNYGQIEIDELYVGLDRNGAQYIIPVQAKGPRDTLGAIQTIQDVTFCKTPRPSKSKIFKKDYVDLQCRAVSAQSFKDGSSEIIAMFELAFDGSEVSIEGERHYSLVPADEITKSDLSAYARGRKGRT